MPLVLTPRQLTQRAELYYQLASLTSAGIGLISALATVADSAATRRFRRQLKLVIEQLEGGSPFSSALVSAGTWLPVFDISLIQAGEQSGRLDLCFRFLSEYYHERARLARQIMSDLLYPAFVAHFAILIFPIGLLTRLVWQADVFGFVTAKLVVLLPLYGAVLLLLYMQQAKHGERWRAWIERVLRAIPVLGSARSNLALARLSLSLESLLNAGVSIVEAWELAAAASGSPTFRRTVCAWREEVLGGVTPAEAVRASHVFPDMFTNLYHTGEISGQLDDTLRRLYRHYQEEGLRQLRAVAQWGPRLIYVLIMLVVAYQIVGFWTNYYSAVNNISF